jgi:hypothetical protein
MKKETLITGLEDVAASDMAKLLGRQKYPSELDRYLDIINEESKLLGWPVVVIKAYCFGVMVGKRHERNKRSAHSHNAEKVCGGKVGGTSS